MVIKVLEHLNDIDVMPILTLILQLCSLAFFSMFMIGFTIKKLMHLMK